MNYRLALGALALTCIALSCGQQSEEQQPKEIVKETRYLASESLETGIYICCERTLDSQELIARKKQKNARKRGILLRSDDTQLQNEVVFEAIASKPRGTLVTANLTMARELDGVTYIPVDADCFLASIPQDKVCNDTLYVKASQLVEKKSECALEKYVYVRTPATVVADSCRIAGFGAKGDSLLVAGADSVLADGSVLRYSVSLLGRQRVPGGASTGHIYGRYVCTSRAEALKKFKAPYIGSHAQVRNTFGGGVATECDFYPVEKPSFPGKPLKKTAYALYLNANPGTLKNIDEYIALAKETKINTFVVDIMDDQNPGYKADAMKRYSPTNYSRAGRGNQNLYVRLVKRLHEEGFYAVGRITCFKDAHFVKDHPECGLSDIHTGELLKHNKSYWPSAYNRYIWEFKVSLAVEAVRKFGFDEINFDYVRFPDRISGIKDRIDFHNQFGESRIQAIQNFVRYACDEIHEAGAYVSIDVFGETANKGYTTEYGQYWPAISNVADVISGMPYPDHFADHAYGISKPWNHPYETLKAWGDNVMGRQQTIPTPAVVRTWIQAYDVMKHVDSNGIKYNAANVEKEIRGLFDAGLTGGYVTWHSGSKLSKYREQSDAFKKDYLN